MPREKTGQAFRDSLHTQYKSFTKAKLARRKDVSDETDRETATVKQENKVAKQVR